jgi:hypothetical protein
MSQTWTGSTEELRRAPDPTPDQWDHVTLTHGVGGGGVRLRTIAITLAIALVATVVAVAMGAGSSARSGTQAGTPSSAFGSAAGAQSAHSRLATIVHSNPHIHPRLGPVVHHNVAPRKWKA